MFVIVYHLTSCGKQNIFNLKYLLGMTLKYLFWGDYVHWYINTAIVYGLSSIG